MKDDFTNILTREEIAKRDIGVTKISKGWTIVFTVFFLGCIYGYFLWQNSYEYFILHEKVPQPVKFVSFSSFSLSTTESWHTWSKSKKVGKSISAFFAPLKQYETELDNRSLLRKYLLAPIQGFLIRTFHLGNEKVVIGREQWYFYQLDINSITNRGFMDPIFHKKRIAEDKHNFPNPLPAILELNEYLKGNGVTLIILPVPVKPSIYSEYLSPKIQETDIPLMNKSFTQFKKTLSENSVLVFDAGPLFAMAKKQGLNLYLKTDTHWSPEGLILVAKELTRFIHSNMELPPRNSMNYKAVEKEVDCIGDVANLLKVNNPLQVFPMEKIKTREIIKDNQLVSRDPNADVLLLGDSFLNAYSTETGWRGIGAGFVENMAYELDRPTDSIIINGGGSLSVRSLLLNEIRKNPNYLKGKKLVIWEFSNREFTYGNWMPQDFQKVTK